MKPIYAFLLPAPCLVLFLACGSGDDGDVDDGNASNDLEQACENYCEASLQVPCGELTLEQCRAACPALEDQLGGICVSEYADLFDCASDFDFTCNDGTPTPSGTGCGAEAQALATCTEDGDCKRYCKALADGGCAGGSEAACVSQCTAETEAGCGSDLEDLHRCQTTFSSGPVCDGDEPAVTAECRRDYVDVVSCQVNGDECATHCEMLELDGCDVTGCAADCAAKTDVSDPCFIDYQQLVDCGDEAGWTCSGAGPTAPEACAFAQSDYDMCLAQNM